VVTILIYFVRSHPVSKRYTLILSYVGVTIDAVLDWMIGFIDALFTHLGTTSNYSAIADLHTLQFTVTHAVF
jgi:hypothetical protein